jgi:hypothetical protein
MMFALYFACTHGSHGYYSDTHLAVAESLDITRILIKGLSLTTWISF